MSYICTILTNMKTLQEQTAVLFRPDLIRDIDPTQTIPLRAGYFPKAEGHRFKRQPIPETVLIYCVNGKGFYRQAGQRRILINAGTLLCCPAQTTHEYGADPDDPWSIYWMHLHPSKRTDWKGHLECTEKHPAAFIGISPDIMDSFDRLIETMRIAEHSTDVLLCSALAQLIVADACCERQHSASPSRVLPHLQDVLDLMKANRTESLSVEQMARVAGLSKEYFIRQFKRTVGTTPGNYFLQMKMRTACDWLVNTDLHIREIAFRLGYEDPFYFSRIFKRLRGISPRQHRQFTQA